MAISNKNVTEGIVRALFGAASGAHLTGLAAANQSSGSVALAGSLAQSAPMILGVDLTDNADFIDHFLTNLGLEADSDEMDAATAWATGQINAGASRGDIVSGAVTFLLGLTDATSPYLAVATAFSTSITASVAWSEGDGKAVLAVTDLQAYIEGGQFTMTAGLEAKDEADAAVADAIEAFNADNETEHDESADVQTDLDAAVTTAINDVQDIVVDWDPDNSAKKNAAEIATVQVDLEEAVANAADALKDAVTALVPADSGTTAKAIRAIKAVVAALETQTDAAAAAAAAEDAVTEATADADAIYAAFVGALDAGTDDSQADYLELADDIYVLTAGANADDLATDMADATPLIITTYLASLQTLADALNAQIEADAAETESDDAVVAKLAVVTGYDGEWVANDELADDAADYVTALETLDEAEAALAALPEALAAYEDAVEAAEAFTALTAAAQEASDALTNNGYNVVDLADADDLEATEDTDVYFTADLAAGETAVITDFGTDGDDQIYIGADVVLSGASDKPAVLELFLDQDGDDVVVTIETETYGYSTEATTDEIVITLVGVDVADLVFANGVLTLG